MTAQPIEHHHPRTVERPPATIREFRGVLSGDDLARFNREIDDVPLHEIDQYLKGWQHVLYLRTIPEIGEALRTAFDRPGIPVGEVFPEWEEISG
ncbi:hypothetical protein [Kitasatospora sp. NBC_01302]|uniref:hypothetical protein n=1 Tax=Kitasatospora sp. NBC_01302 TaxID=2903575 RepID=UPI002E13D0E8|nr:hypothetical protein OG294_14165 [Kitasatospora sp. NBC_01302]